MAEETSSMLDWYGCATFKLATVWLDIFLDADSASVQGER